MTYSHEPPNYDCPFCKLVRGQDDEINRRDHIVYQDEKTLAYISPQWWENNRGHVLVIPKEHTENIYAISDEDLAAVYKTARKMAIALKEAYGCEGTSMRQHNEPAGNQTVFHLHVHIFPRYKDDQLYQNFRKSFWANDEERMGFVKKLKGYLGETK